MAQSVGLAVDASNGDVCLKGLIKILVKRSSTYREFSSSLMSPGKRLENVFLDSAVNWQGGKLCYRML